MISCSFYTLVWVATSGREIPEWNSKECSQCFELGRDFHSLQVFYSFTFCRRHVWDRICIGLCCRSREVADFKSLAEILESKSGNEHQHPPPPVWKEQMRNFTSWTHGPLTCVILDNPLQCQAMDHLTCCWKKDFLMCLERTLPMSETEFLSCFTCGREPQQNKPHKPNTAKQKKKPQPAKKPKPKAEQGETLQKIELSPQNISQTNLDKIHFLLHLPLFQGGNRALEKCSRT